ncbi:hypothetical protein DFH11DRAFT_1733651 [Phellopilus nigrolimitatus]|nr:hypothetical protein DFH11DRAFT_1733651 [Phellopilus nigrolimitatus]
MSQVQLTGFSGSFEARSLYIVYLGKGKDQTYGFYWSKDGQTGELAPFVLNPATGSRTAFKPNVGPKQLVDRYGLETAVQIHKNYENTAWYDALQQLFSTPKAWKDRKHWLSYVVQRSFDSIFARVGDRARPAYSKVDKNAAVVGRLEYFGIGKEYGHKIIKLSEMEREVQKILVGYKCPAQGLFEA